MEFLHLEYEGGDKLYVPVSQLHVISRYTGASPGDRRRCIAWEAASGRRPSARPRGRCATPPPSSSTSTPSASRARASPSRSRCRSTKQFAATFPFEETPDQAAAIQAVIVDMTAGPPHGPPRVRRRGLRQDRGRDARGVHRRGRRASRSRSSCPTTLLAEQHFRNFSDRFSAFPVKIAELSRFRSPKEVAKSLEGLANGTIDIVIGTHKLIQKDVHVQEPGPGDHRRGASLRRAPEGGVEEACAPRWTCSRSPPRPSRARSRCRSRACAISR